MKHGQVTIKDLDEFLRFTLCDYDMRTIDDNYISILLPRQFDINKVFGLDVCDDDYVVLYLCWYPDKDVFGRQFEMDIRCCGGKDDSWTEAILYDDTGREVVATEPCDGFTGCWELKDEDTNTVYRVHVMTKSNLN